MLFVVTQVISAGAVMVTFDDLMMIICTIRQGEGYVEVRM